MSVLPGGQAKANKFGKSLLAFQQCDVQVTVNWKAERK